MFPVRVGRGGGGKCGPPRLRTPKTPTGRHGACLAHARPTVRAPMTSPIVHASLSPSPPQHNEIRHQVHSQRPQPDAVRLPADALGLVGCLGLVAALWHLRLGRRRLGLLLRLLCRLLRLVALLDLAQRSLASGRADLGLLAPLRLNDIKRHTHDRLGVRLVHLARLRITRGTSRDGRGVPK
eukprot:scaffold14253_cov143-Isochrysis_galbana.AAC.2